MCFHLCGVLALKGHLSSSERTAIAPLQPVNSLTMRAEVAFIILPLLDEQRVAQVAGLDEAAVGSLDAVTIWHFVWFQERKVRLLGGTGLAAQPVLLAMDQRAADEAHVQCTAVLERCYRWLTILFIFNVKLIFHYVRNSLISNLWPLGTRSLRPTTLIIYSQPTTQFYLTLPKPVKPTEK